MTKFTEAPKGRVDCRPKEPLGLAELWRDAKVLCQGGDIALANFIQEQAWRSEVPGDFVLFVVPKLKVLHLGK